MRHATLGIVLSQGKLLLGEKKRGEIGTGMLCGPGGKIDAGESPAECLIRETREELEIELDPHSIALCCVLDIYAAGTHDFTVYVLSGSIAYGDVHETPDMVPNWYSVRRLPFRRMYEADEYWLPRALSGERFRATIYYRERAVGFERIVFRALTEPVERQI